MSRTLGYITPVPAHLSANRIYMQAASGRVADALAKHYDKVYICARILHGPSRSVADPPFDASNIELIPQPFWSSSAESLLHFFGIVGSYARTCRRADVLFVRGMCPYIGMLYLCAFMFRRPVCHWIVGDPAAVLRTGPRKGRILDTMALVFAWHDRNSSRLGRWFTEGAFICNGRELAQKFTSPRTVTAVSSTVSENEFFPREDTCQGRAIRILFVGYIRPEKGIEYLLDAVQNISAGVPWELEIVGPDEFPEYRRHLNKIVNTLGIQNRVRWMGYAPYGEPLFERMRAADIFVLPTLSEGTPHVLVEARANGLPCISTNVGGIPTVVTNRVDALLVPPANSRALSQAIERVIYDGDLRRSLIRAGLQSARKQTLEYFIEIVRAELDAGMKVSEAAVLQ